MARWKQVDDLLKHLVNVIVNDKTCDYKLEESVYNDCYKFCSTNIKNHSFLDTDEREVERIIDGTAEKLIIHGLELKSQQLQKQCHRFLTSALYGEEILHEKTQTHYSILHFLFFLSQSPTSTNIKPSNDITEKYVNQTNVTHPFDWKSYLLDGEDVVMHYSSSSSEKDDDDELNNIGKTVLVTVNNENIKLNKIEADKKTNNLKKFSADEINKDVTQNKNEDIGFEVNKNIEGSLGLHRIDDAFEKLEALKDNLNENLTKTYWMAYGDYSFNQSIPHNQITNNITNSKNINCLKSWKSFHSKFTDIGITFYENDETSYCFDLQQLSISLFIDEGFSNSFKTSSQLFNSHSSNNGFLYNFTLEDDGDKQHTSGYDTASDVPTYTQHETASPLLYKLNDFYINNDKLKSFCNMHVLSEDNLISEIIWLFTGLASTFTFKWLNGEYIVNNCVAVNFLGQKCLHKLLQEYALYATMMKKLEQFIEALTHPNNLSTYLQNHHYSQWDFNDMQFMFKFQSITNSHQAFASVLSDWLSHVRKTFLSVEEALKAKKRKSILGLMVELKDVFKVLDLLHSLLEDGVVKPLVAHLSSIKQHMSNQKADDDDKNSNDLCNQITHLNHLYTPTQSCLHLFSCIYNTFIQYDLLDCGWNEARNEPIEGVPQNGGYPISEVSELQLLASVWLEVVRPCLQLLDDWLRRGVFDDHLDEFFIKKTKYWEERTESFWEKSLEVVGSEEEHAFLKKSLILLVNTGKSFGLIGSINEVETTNISQTGGVGNGGFGESLYHSYKSCLLASVPSCDSKKDGITHADSSSDELQRRDEVQINKGSSAVCDGKSEPSLPPTSSLVPQPSSAPSQQPSSSSLLYWDEELSHTFIRDQNTHNNPYLYDCLNKSLAHFIPHESSLNTISNPCGGTGPSKLLTNTRKSRMHLRHRQLEQVIKDFTAQCYTAVSRTITTSVALPHRFYKHFTIVKKCFLMESGRSMHDFYCSFFHAIQTEKHWYEETYLTFLLQQAFMDEQCDTKDDDDDDMLTRLSISMDTSNGEVCNKDINSISLLSLKYQVPWPCSIMLSEENMRKYEDIFKFILMLKHAKYSLDSLHFVEIKVPRGSKVCRDLVHRLHLFRMKVLNFANSFDFYVMTRIIESSSVSFEQQIQECEGIQALIHLHQHYLDLLYNRCLLKQKTSFLKDLIIRVLQISLNIYHLWLDFSRDASCEEGADVPFSEEVFVKKFEGFSTKEKEFSRCVKFLSSTVNQVIIRGTFPYLESLAFTLSSCTESCQDKLFTDTDH